MAPVFGSQFFPAAKLFSKQSYPEIHGCTISELMLNAGSQTPEMAEEEEVTEVLVESWLPVMQTWIGDLHYAIRQTKKIAPVFSGIKIQHPVLSMHLKKY